ncbi:MAG: hypothetical protein ABDI20_09415 [Candidatus Bipolaricaulaceae bacterium]
MNVTLTFSGKIPLGASLLLSHEFALEEVWPKEYLPRRDALTKFKGTQTVTPAAAVFFGKPTLKLAKVDEQAVLSTDGETIGLLSGRLLVSPWELAEVTARTLSNYRLTTQPSGACPSRAGKRRPKPVMWWVSSRALNPCACRGKRSRSRLRHAWRA